jgi:hypothetical protein
MKSTPTRLTGYLFRSDEGWDGIALEFDIYETGPTLKSVWESLQDRVIQQLNFVAEKHSSLDSAFFPAAEQYQKSAAKLPMPDETAVRGQARWSIPLKILDGLSEKTRELLKET